MKSERNRAKLIRPFLGINVWIETNTEIHLIASSGKPSDAAYMIDHRSAFRRFLRVGIRSSELTGTEFLLVKAVIL